MSGHIDRVLKVFAVHDSQAGEVLLANHFVSVGQRKGWDIPDLQRGVEEAYARGFIEKAPLGWRLTKKGFDEVAALKMPISQTQG